MREVAPDALSFEAAAQARHRASLARLRVDPTRFFRWPLFPLHALTGALAPGEVLVVGAAPQNGKSLLTHNLIRWTHRASLPAYVFGTEQSAEVLAIKQACVNVGVPFKLVLKPEFHELADGTHAEACQQVEAELERLAVDAHLVQWSTAPAINRAVLAEGVQWAVEEMGAELVALDHLHHVEQAHGVSAVEEVTRTMHLFKRLCVEHQIVGVALAQLRRGVGLRGLEPPGLEDFAGASALERTADVALTLFRPLRLDLTKGAVKDLRKAAREGHAPAPDVFEPMAMGVHLVKDRLGSSYGQTCVLHIRKGQLEELPEKDRYATDYDTLRAA